MYNNKIDGKQLLINGGINDDVAKLVNEKETTKYNPFGTCFLLKLSIMLTKYKLNIGQRIVPKIPQLQYPSPNTLGVIEPPGKL